MSTGETHHTTDYRFSWWFSLGWTVLLAITLLYVAIRSDQTITEVLQAERADGLAALAAGWLSAWVVPLLGGGSVTIGNDRLRVRRFRDRLFGRTLDLRTDDIVHVEEVYRAMVRSHVLRITTTDGSHIDIQHQMLRASSELKSALLALEPGS